MEIDGKTYEWSDPFGSKSELVEIHGITYRDTAINSELSIERQLELLKNNLALAMKRIHNYGQHESALSKVVVKYCLGELEYLTNIKCVDPDEN